MAAKDMNLFISINEESDFDVLKNLITEAETVYKAGGQNGKKYLTIKHEHSGFEIKFEETVEFDTEER